MKKEGVDEDSPIIAFVGGLYKVIGFWSGELKTRLFGVRNESWGLVVFESGIMKEVTA